VRAILDTSVLIAVAEGELQGDELEGELAISTVSLAEIHFGVLVSRDDLLRARRLRLLSAVERTFDALPVDDAVVASYGELAATVAAKGRKPRTRSMDLLIAATAHAHSARLYTANPGDLLGVDQLVEVVGV
jgi:predicted nucleic acid-binding protein